MESRGGINLIWKNTKLDQEIRLKIPASQAMEQSLYYRQEENSQLIKNHSLEQIYQLLIWLSTEQSIYRF